MATLTETAYRTRKSFKYVFFAVISLLLIKFIISQAGSLWQTTHPPAPPQPTHSFGKLPPINFPAVRNLQGPITYTQEFIGEVLPESSPSAKVFFTPQSRPSFLSPDRAKEFARILDFKAEPAALSATQYQWTDFDSPSRTLQKDIVNGNFLLSYDYNKDRSVFTERNLPSGKTAISEARALLEKYGVMSSDLSEDNAIVSFWQYSGTDLTPAISISEADAVRVDFFRSPIEGLPMVTATFKEAPVYFIFSGSSGKKRVLALYYIFRPTEREIFSTYSLKTTIDAWADLTAGKGYIANWGGIAGPNVAIRKVSLAYYDSQVYEPYLQPVFVFEGDEGFRAYVTAVAREWTE